MNVQKNKERQQREERKRKKKQRESREKRKRKRERKREKRKRKEREEKRAEKNHENPYPHFCNISPANHPIEAPTGHPGPQNAPQNGSKNLQNPPKLAPGALGTPPLANLPQTLISEVNFGPHFGTGRGPKNRPKIDFFLKKARQGAFFWRIWPRAQFFSIFSSILVRFWAKNRCFF